MLGTSTSCGANPIRSKTKTSPTSRRDEALMSTSLRGGGATLARKLAPRATGPRGPRNSSLKQTSVGDQSSRQERRLRTGPMRRASRVASGGHVTILRRPIEAFIPGESAAGDSLTRPSWRLTGLAAFRIRSGKPPVRGPLDAKKRSAARLAGLPSMQVRPLGTDRPAYFHICADR
jgi:hypothetical protein